MQRRTPYLVFFFFRLLKYRLCGKHLSIDPYNARSSIQKAHDECIQIAVPFFLSLKEYQHTFLSSLSCAAATSCKRNFCIILLLVC